MVLFVRRERDDQWDDATWMGMRDLVREGLCSDAPCTPALAVLDDGRVTWDADTQARLDVDEAGALMRMCVECDRLPEMADASYLPGGITACYQFYRCYDLLKKLSSHAPDNSTPNTSDIAETHFNGLLKRPISHAPDNSRPNTSVIAKSHFMGPSNRACTKDTSAVLACSACSAEAGRRVASPVTVLANSSTSCSSTLLRISLS